MGLIRDTIIKYLNVPNATAYDTISGMFLTRSAAFKNRSKDALADSYEGIIYSCVNKIAENSASIPINVYSKVSTNNFKNIPINKIDLEYTKKAIGLELPESSVKLVENHPLIDLLNNPNPYQTKFDLIEQTIINLELFGNAYWLVDFNSFNVPSQLQILCSKFMVPNIDNGVIMNYTYGGTQTIETKNIIHLQCPNPSNPLIGMGSLQASFTAYSLLRSSNEYDQAMFDNMGIPSVLITSKSKVAKEVKDKFIADWKNKYGGTNKSGSIGFLDGEIEIKTLGYPQKDTTIVSTREYAIQEIASIFGIPMSMIKGDATNKASAEAGLYEFAKFTLSPKLARISQQLTKQLASLYDPNLIIAFANPVPDDVEQLITKVDVLLKYNVITPDEARKIIGI